LAATPSALPYCYRALTHFEAPGQLREIREGLEEMDEKQLRLLIIQGMADGNAPAARSQFLHATDCLGEATKIFAERTHIYQPVIVRWPSAAVHEDFRWDIGGGNRTARSKLDDESGDPDDITAKLGWLRDYADKRKEVVLLRRPASDDQEWWRIYELRWRPAAEWKAPRLFLCVGGEALSQV